MEIQITAREYFELWTEPEPNTGCLLWTRDSSEYGDARYKGKRVLAHRFSYLLNIGDIPDGGVVCHKCDTPGCVSPSHLWLGTIAENNIDKTKKKRHPFGSRASCSKGHLYVDGSYSQRKTYRDCLVCKRENSKARRKRKVLNKIVTERALL